jgi:uncharacterized coiled-coil protein SlyX
MPRLLNLVQRSALVLTGVSIGAALWKSRTGASATGETGPLKESVIDLEARLAALETAGRSAPVVDNNSHGRSAETLAAVASLEASVASLTTRYDSRLVHLEARVSDHEAKLKELPTLAQVVSTMEEMLSSTMSGLDNKLSEQVRSIEVLKTTVAQSDELMERVLDSIYSLQSHVAENDKSEVPVSV